ncbi:MAG TPA: glycosyltransferase, partial [Lacipirellulaceae bacterium]|nr:glycosyltransferase [Lacipirellulaceae bacterium]
IVVLDDGSDDGDTAAAAALEFSDPRIRSYRVESSLGVAGGRNFLMEQARGEILVSIDDDAVFVGDRALDEVCTIFAHCPDAAAVAFRVTNIVNGVRRLNIPFSKSAIVRNAVIGDRQTQVSYFIGCGHAIRKAFVQAHGGYRADMVFGEEELDIAYRIVRAGYGIVYAPSIEVDHFPRPSVVERRKRRNTSELSCHVRNRAYLAYRYLPWKYAVPYVCIWMMRYAVDSLRDNSFADFLRGAVATPQFLRGVRREVLNPTALMYLAKNGGRLWY